VADRKKEVTKGVHQHMILLPLRWHNLPVMNSDFFGTTFVSLQLSDMMGVQQVITMDRLLIIKI
jgi:hypothetical protein